MREERTTAVAVGILSIVCTAAGIAAGATGAPTELAAMRDARGAVLLQALFIAVMAVTATGIAAMFYPVLAADAATRGRKGMAVWYAGTRVAEGAIMLVVATVPLVKLALVDADGAAPVAAALDAFSDYGVVAAQTVFCVGAALLGWLLLVSGRVPGWLAVVGLAAAPLMLVSGFLLPFTHDPNAAASTILYAPMAVGEMVLAVWLIARGLRPVAVRSPEPAPRSALVG